MSGRLKTFLSLPGEQKRLFLRAYLLLGAMRFAILTRSFKSLVAGRELHGEALELAPAEVGELAVAHQVGWAVRKAAQFTPWQSACLVQVLTAQRMLAQRGISGVFYLGASTGNGAELDPPLSAHAWLKCGQDFITGEAGHQRFTVVSSFSW